MYSGKRINIIRTSVILFVFILTALVLTACAENKPGQDKSALTMYVGLGNTNGTYYSDLHDLVLDKTGIDVKYVYNNTLDTTSAMFNHIDNCDLPADIMVIAMKATDYQQKNAFLDLASYTDIPELFSSLRMRELSIEGGIYQLPYTSRLIGIEYNKTLMDEMGWTVPQTFEDMLDLKQKVDAAGVRFAVCGGAATGHGFNYLMHLMGTQYLSTPDGNKWLNNYQKGAEPVDSFAGAADYFKRYVEAGLFGDMHDSDWQANSEFSRERVLFYYNILNDINSYDGFMYTHDGRIAGADYDENGNVRAYEADDGNAVWDGAEYIYYDESNENHKALKRYNIEGAVVLHDEYATIPWISENGSSNCYAYFDSMYVSLNKNLSDPDKSEKLDKACRVLEVMASEDAAELFISSYRDGYVAADSFEISDNMLYCESAENIQKGYLMPWYYNYFDSDSIINVGAMVNEYIKAGGIVSDEAMSQFGMDDIIKELDQRNKNHLIGSVDVLCHVDSTLGFKECAQLQAVANAMSLQQRLDSQGSDVEVTAAMLPYAEDFSDLLVGTKLPVVQEYIYAGDFQDASIRSYIGGRTCEPVAVKISGAELKEISEGGYSTLEDYGYDHIFKYSLMLKYDSEIDVNKDYVLAIDMHCLSSSLVSTWRENKMIIGDVAGSTEDGLRLFFEKNEIIDPQSIIWE